LKIVKIILRTGYVLFLVLAILLILTAAALRFSGYVQTQVAQYAAAEVSQLIGYPIQITKAKLSWPDRLVLSQLKVKDTFGTQMLDIEKLEIDFSWLNLTDSTNLNIDHVSLLKPKIIYEIDSLSGQQNLQEFIAKINKLTASSKPKNPKKRPQLFTIDKAEIVDGIFEYRYNKVKPRLQPGRFDESHFTIQNLNASIKDFLAIRDTISLKANISGVDKYTTMPIHKLKTDFLICNKSMIFADLMAHIGQTKIKEFLRFDYKKQSDMGDFFNKVLITARLDSSRLHYADIAHFIPDIKQYGDTWHLTGQMKGLVNNFKLSQAKVYFGQKSRLVGNFTLKGLPNTDKLYMDLAMKNSYVLVNDLKPYISTSTYTDMQPMQFVGLDGSFTGTRQAFKTNGSLQTALGQAKADLNLKLKPNKAQTEYAGRLQLENFRIGQLLGSGTQLENVSMDGKIKGIGLSVKDAVLEVDGEFKNIDYRGYKYHHVYLQGKLQKELFEGHAASKDSNLVLDMRGIVDLRNGRENFNISGNLHKVNLKKIKVSQQDVSLSTNFNLSFSGTNIDNVLGFARFHDLHLRIDDRRLHTDTLFVFSEKIGSLRDIVIDSDLARVHFDGNFTPSIAIQDVLALGREYKDYFFENKYKRNEYYRSKLVDRNKQYHINYSLNLLEAKELLAFFEPNIYMSDYSKLEGTFQMGNTVVLNAEGKIDSLSYGGYSFKNNEFDINTSKFIDSPEVLASGMVYSEKQKLNILAPTEKLVFEGAWDRDRIVFNSNLAQQNATNRADLNGTIQFTDFGLDLQFKRSKFTLLDKVWLINPENTINITASSLCLKDMTIENEGQILALNGTVSADSLETLRVQTTNFSLASIAPILDTDLQGTLNANATINNLFANMAIEGDMHIDSLIYKKIHIGNVAGTTVWDKADQNLNIQYSITRDQINALNLEGVYKPNQLENSLDLVANFNKTSLKIIEPFTQEIFSKFEGEAQGKIQISGTPTVPILEGELRVNGGRAQIDYLKAIINFDEKIVFEPNKISTDKLVLTDTEGHKGQLRGGVMYSNGLTKFRLNLNGELDNFKILNTTAKDNELFYGTAYATGNLSVTGPIDNIMIRANATSNKGTKIYIPLDGATSVSNADYIEYITSMPDSTLTTEAVSIKKTIKKEPSHISMDFNFNVTPDAYCEIQVDRKTGDNIKAYGQADLNLKVNTQGDFSLTGIYELQRGDYSFNFEGVVTKNFKILPKSKITWTGDPLEGDLDIRAEYTQYTSLAPIFPAGSASTGTSAATELNRKFPVSVVLKMKDRMLSPTISYDIDIKDFPRTSEFNNNVLAFKNRIGTDEQLLGMQVGSLLLAQRLSEQQSDILKFENFTNNFAEYLSNQLGKLASGDNFQLGINAGDFSTTNQNLINSMQLEFSYNFDDRLRINHSRSGLLGNNNQNNASGNGLIIGDWSLEWLITKDGRLRLKGYNRNTPNVFQNLNNYITSYGASLVYTKSFKKLFSNKKVMPKDTTTKEKTIVMQQ
jgi:hypothetical protein